MVAAARVSRAVATAATPVVQRAPAPPKPTTTTPPRRAPVDPRFSTVLQARSLQVSSPSDPAEKEAESTAKKVVSMPAPTATVVAGSGGGVQRRPIVDEEKKVGSKLDPQRIGRAASTLRVARATELTPRIARKIGDHGGQGTNVAAEINGAKGGGAPLPASVRSFMEPRFGADFGKVRIHTGARAAKLGRELSAQAFTVQEQIFFGKDRFRPETREGKELIAHELTHTIQQGSAVQRSADVSVTERSTPHVQRLGMSDVLDFFADKANMIPGYRMFTIVLGVNPINMSAVDRSAANILRAIVEFLPGGGLITQALDAYGVFDKVGNWIETQLASLGLSGATIKQAVTDFIGSLGVSDLFSPGDVWDRAKRIFTTPIDRIISFVKSLAVTVLKFIKDAILRPLAELAAQTPGWDLLCAVLGRNPITGDAVPRTAETLIGGFMKLIGQEEIWENIKKGNAIARAFAWFQSALSGLLGFVQQIPGLFLAAVQSLEIADIVLLPRAFVKVGRAFGGFFVQFMSWAGSTIWDLLEIIFSVVAPGVMGYVRKAAAAFKKIIKDPIGFVGNLVKAGKQGFSQFAGNFVGHLKKSLIGWLMGALRGAGIYIPQALTLVEIGKCVLSIAGISWPQIRAKIVKALGSNGETIMKVLETGFDIVVALVKGGPAAAWDVIKDKLSNLRDLVLQAIIDFVKDRVITAAVTKLVSMLSPAGAFIQAIIATYNTIMFFVERLRQIAQVVASFIDSISAIANGVIAAAANRVEQTLGGLLTLVISFLARLAGLGKVSDFVVAKIKAFQERVDKALDKAVTWIVERGKAVFAKLKGKKDGELAPIAKQMAEKGWASASKASKSQLQREAAIKGLLKEAESGAPAGAKAKVDLKTSGTTWQVTATVSKDGKQGTATAGSGWIAEDLQGKPAFAGQNLASFHQKLITDAVAQLSAGSGEKPLRESYDEKVALAKQIEQRGQGQIAERMKGIKFTIELEPFAKVEGDRAIETTLTIAPNKERLKANVPAAAAAGLEPLRKALEASKILGKQQPSVDRILRVCEKIAKKNGATVAVQNRNAAAPTSPVAFMVVFTVGADKLELPVERTSSGPECASCEGPAGTTTPHNYVAEKDLRAAITLALTSVVGALTAKVADDNGVVKDLSDHTLIVEILGRASVGGQAVSQGTFQKQCARCEGQVAGVPGHGTFSLVQRVRNAQAAGAAAKPEDVGRQFGGTAATPTEAAELTKMKIKRMANDIGSVISRFAARKPLYAVAKTLNGSVAAVTSCIEAEAWRRAK
ncbi:Hypothetical protein A7982_02248 [Minicystis rosea]|nr:Hypothetical protein A7982_02248 [Minicystis rosea]